MLNKITYLILEDKYLIREALIALLAKHERFELIGKIEKARELRESLRSSKPDIVLLDIDMCELNGISALSIIRSFYHDVKVLMLSNFFEKRMVSVLLKDGANGYFNYKNTETEFIEALIQIHERGFYLNEKLSNELLLFSVRTPEKILADQELSQRELEVLNLLISGKTEKEIASKLNISYNTVHSHRKKIYKKTQTHSLVGLLNFITLPGKNDTVS